MMRSNPGTTRVRPGTAHANPSKPVPIAATGSNDGETTWNGSVGGPGPTPDGVPPLPDVVPAPVVPPPPPAVVPMVPGDDEGAGD